MLGAHRFSYEIYKGKIPKGMCVCHKCDTPSCVNPNHLFVGTHADNMADKVKKKRSRSGVFAGEMNPRAKLTTLDVQLIRNQYAGGGITQREIGEKFDVSSNTVSQICTGKRWPKND
jgi:DNA-binding XRE family transcriptional regulator